HHTLRIDRYHQNTWDKAAYKGHFYSDKAPGTAVLGAVVYAGFAAARAAPVLGGGISALEKNGAWNDAIALGRSDTQYAPAAKGRKLGGCQRTGLAGNVQVIPWGNRLVPPVRDWALSKYVTTIGVDGLLSALFIAFFFWFLGFFSLRAAHRWILTGLYAVATIALPYSTVFYSHQLVAGFLFMAFGLIWLRSRRKVGFWSLPAAGFLMGFSLFTEYTVALMVIAIGIYALWLLRRDGKGIGAMAIAGAVPVAALCAYNYASFGNALDTGYAHDFCWSAAQGAGYAGFTYPKLGPLFDLTFGSFRGLFYISPFLLLAVPGAYVMWRRRLGLEAALCLVIAVSFIVAISAYWGWNGGRVDGPRYLVPIVPFLAFPVAFFLDAGRRSRLAMTLAALLGAWSVFVTWTLFAGGLLFPTSWLRDPLFQYSLPALGGNQIPPNAGFFLGLSGWVSLLPLAGLLLLIAVVPRRRATRRPAPGQDTAGSVHHPLGPSGSELALGEAPATGR
ncbi:MAG: hypothetical protein ACRDFX_02140, partial [Chloroflexota bacterium]